MLAGQSRGSLSASIVRFFPPTLTYIPSSKRVDSNLLGLAGAMYTHTVNILHPGGGVIRLGVKGDGRSLVGRLRPP